MTGACLCSPLCSPIEQFGRANLHSRLDSPPNIGAKFGLTVGERVARRCEHPDLRSLLGQLHRLSTFEQLVRQTHMNNSQPFSGAQRGHETVLVASPEVCPPIGRNTHRINSRVLTLSNHIRIRVACLIALAFTGGSRAIVPVGAESSSCSMMLICI